MATDSQTPWYLRYPKRWQHFRSVPAKRLWLLLVAVFLLFSVIGFYYDLMANGTTPYAAVLLSAVFSGANAALWIIILARLPMVFLLLLAAFQFFNGALITVAANWMDSFFHFATVQPASGIRFASNAILIVVITSYVFFVAFIRKEGKESFKLRNELELAHGIQKTLVPPVTLRTERFELYGRSEPSDKVGGDLVDAVRLSNGDAIAYLADIAGHGLQAGILMGMLKTATRTALLDAGEREPHQTMPLLLERLNSVLPEVKEPHMYATFTGFRLGADGSVFYALAASPPVLHWHANRQMLSYTEEPQFPLGLLPVPEFDGNSLEMSPGDLVVVATDGILEVCNKPGDEFGVERLKAVIADNVKSPLPELAERILTAARSFGRQLDDQTILIVRCF